MAGTWPTEALREKFVDGITAAQTMGMPVDEADRPTFYFADERIYAEADSAGRPWDPRGADEPTGTAPRDPVQVVCGKKVLSTRTDQTAAGAITPVEVQLTFLPDAWALVSDFVYVEIAGIRYARGQTAQPPSALFDTEITRVTVRAPDGK